MVPGKVMEMTSVKWFFQWKVYIYVSMLYGHLMGDDMMRSRDQLNPSGPFLDSEYESTYKIIY